MSIRTKIVGVTFPNEDGSNRQDIISSLHVGDWVRMVDCASAQYPEAIGIFTQGWKQCGHLTRFEAERIRFAAPKNFKDFPVYVTAVTGGNGQNRGCNIEIEGITYKTEPDEHGQLVKRVYVDYPTPYVLDVPKEDACSSPDYTADAMADAALQIVRESEQKSFSEKLGSIGQHMIDAGDKMQKTGKAVQKAGVKQTVGCITFFVCAAVIAIVYFIISGIFK